MPELTPHPEFLLIVSPEFRLLGLHESSIDDKLDSAWPKGQLFRPSLRGTKIYPECHKPEFSYFNKTLTKEVPTHAYRKTKI
jgi:hypothetical protein